MKKLFATVIGASALLMAPSMAGAFSPDKPECIAPAKPGGGFDLTCRIAITGFESLSLLDKPMQVTFMPGGIGAVAIAHMTTTRRNDPNVIVAFSGGSLLNIAQGKFGANVNADSVRWLAAAGADYGAVVVKSDSPWKNLDDLIKAVEAEPKKYVVGAGGTVGSQDWMKGAFLMKAAGVKPQDMRYVAFEGGGESIAALLGDHIQIYTGDVAEFKGRLGDGTVRMLATLSDKQLGGEFAEVPSAKAQGYDIEWTIVRGYYMGPDVSDEVYDFWTAKWQDAYKSDEYAKVREEKGLFEFNMAGAEFADFVKGRIAAYQEVAKDAGLMK